MCFLAWKPTISKRTGRNMSQKTIFFFSVNFLKLQFTLIFYIIPLPSVKFVTIIKRRIVAPRVCIGMCHWYYLQFILLKLLWRPLFSIGVSEETMVSDFCSLPNGTSVFLFINFLLMENSILKLHIKIKSRFNFLPGRREMIFRYFSYFWRIIKQKGEKYLSCSSTSQEHQMKVMIYVDIENALNCSFVYHNRLSTKWKIHKCQFKDPSQSSWEFSNW